MRFQNTKRFAVITTFKSRFSVKKEVSVVIPLFRTVGIRLPCKCEPSVLFYNALVFGKKSDAVLRFSTPLTPPQILLVVLWFDCNAVNSKPARDIQGYFAMFFAWPDPVTYTCKIKTGILDGIGGIPGKIDGIPS